MGSRTEGRLVREIFPPEPKEPSDPGRVFYTIRPEDVRKTTIQTEIGPIHVGPFMGGIQRNDVGKRLYRVPNNAGDMWFWQVENQEQYIQRMIKGDR